MEDRFVNQRSKHVRIIPNNDGLMIRNRPNLNAGKKGLKKLARRAGCKRVSKSTYEDMNASLNTFLRVIVKDAIEIASFRYQSKPDQIITVQGIDVIYALKRNGRELYFHDAKSTLTCEGNNHLIRNIDNNNNNEIE